MNTSWPTSCASLSAEGLNSTANDAWFSAKTAPIDGEEETGCHPDEAKALKDYLRGELTPAAASQIITSRISSAENPTQFRYRLWALLCDALFELSDYTKPLVALLSSTSALPSPGAEVLEGSELWSGLPGFGHMWADVHKQSHWRSSLASSDPSLRSVMAKAHVHRARVEAEFALQGVMPLDWGFETASDALESGEAVLDFEIPAAVVWIQVAGALLRKGPESGSCWALERKGRFWSGKITESRWALWKTRFKQNEDIGDRIRLAAEEDQKEMRK